MTTQTPTDHHAAMDAMGRRARRAALALASVPGSSRNAALRAMATLLVDRCEPILEANAHDVQAALAAQLAPAAIDRLKLTPARVEAIAAALRQIADLPDPVGQITNMTTRPNGLRIGRMRTPIGVVGIIYESRPNVTADAAALCLKSGNACILRGGSESFESNRAIAAVLAQAAAAHDIPDGAIQMIDTTDRSAVGALLAADRWVDLIIPRGGKSLIERVTAESRIPVIKHLDGNCFVYVDAGADHDMAAAIVQNAKVQRPGVCNAMETLLVHAAEAPALLPRLGEELAAAGVELRGCPRTRQAIPSARPASESDWYEEYLALVLAIKVVDSFEEAVAMINECSSHHTEAIVTRDHERAMRFIQEVDSACVHVNCSTRFSDGGEYGLGAEIGISTNRLHARGPMGLEELTTYKWVVFGNGQVRS